VDPVPDTGYPYIVPETVPVNWALLHPGHSCSAFRKQGTPVVSRAFHQPIQETKNICKVSVNE
jgi:hypothetical protein